MKSIYEKFNLALIDVVVILSGLALLLLMGYFNNATVQTLLEAIGTSLIAAGLVTYLTRRVYSQEQHDTVKVMAENRIVLDDEYKRRKESAHQLDIVAIALSGALRELAGDYGQKMLRRILFDRAKVRLIFLNPLAGYVKQRAIEDMVSHAELQEMLKQSVIHCIAIYKRLKEFYQSAVESGKFIRDMTGSLEIRMTEMCPHFTIYRTDDVILWGLYTAGIRGLDSAVLQVPKEQNILFGQLVNHFDKLWDKNLSGSSGESFLVRYYAPNVPTLNEELLEKVLGSAWKESHWKSN